MSAGLSNIRAMSMGTAHFVHVDLHVRHRQAYLVDDEATGPHGLPDDDPAHPVGIIRVEEGAAFLITGADTGTVGFTVAVADRDPGPEDEFEDIVEVNFRSAVGRVALHEWGGPAYELPPLPAGPGWYRLRYPRSRRRARCPRRSGSSHPRPSRTCKGCRLRRRRPGSHPPSRARTRQSDQALYGWLSRRSRACTGAGPS